MVFVFLEPLAYKPGYTLAAKKAREKVVESNQRLTAVDLTAQSQQVKDLRRFSFAVQTFKT